MSIISRRTFTTGLTAPLLFGALHIHAQTPIKLKFAVFSPEHEFIYRTTLTALANRISAKTGNQAEVVLYPNGALGKNPVQQVQLLQDQVADLAFVITSFTPGRFPDTDVIELPGLFNNLTEGTRVFTDLVQSGHIRDYENYKILGAWTTPPFSVHGTFPIRDYRDLNGKKIRVSGVVQRNALQALGAVPIAIPPTEVPEALARKTIDGATSQPDVLFDFGYVKLTNSDYFIHLGIVPIAILMTQAKYKKLPLNIQTAIDTGTLEWSRDDYIAKSAPHIEELMATLKADKSRTVVIPTTQEQLEAGKLMQPSITAFLGQRPDNQRIYDEIQRLLKRYRS